MDKGTTFELKALEGLRAALANNRLGLLPDACKVFHRKGYPSRDRGKDIVIDISIELHLPGASTWSLLWAWECKDYTRSVPVDDIEEFWAKLNQIAGVNVKGGFVVSGCLQESALNYAKAKGFAVVRLLPENQIDHILHEMSPGPKLSLEEVAERKLGMAVKAMTEPDFRANRHKFFGLFDTNAVFEWSPLIEGVLGTAAELREIGGIFCQRVEDVFAINGKVATCGPITIGKIVLGERVTLLRDSVEYDATVSGIEMFSTPMNEAGAGDYVCLLFSDLPQGVISRDIIVANDRAITLLHLKG